MNKAPPPFPSSWPNHFIQKLGWRDGWRDGGWACARGLVSCDFPEAASAGSVRREQVRYLTTALPCASLFSVLSPHCAIPTATAAAAAAAQKAGWVRVVVSE